jgi:hypothetical protein
MSERDDVDMLAEIVDLLAAKLARDRPKDETLYLIAQRARDLYRKRMLEDK